MHTSVKSKEDIHTLWTEWKKIYNETIQITYKQNKNATVQYCTCINFLTEAVSKPVGIYRKIRTGKYIAALPIIQ